MPRDKNILRKKLRIRKKIKGSKEEPRVSVFKSLRSIYVQAIDDGEGHTICSVMIKQRNNIAAFKEASELFSEKLKEAKVSRLKFDRNGLKYHGAVKEFADGLRSKGFVF